MKIISKLLSPALEIIGDLYPEKFKYIEQYEKHALKYIDKDLLYWIIDNILVHYGIENYKYSSYDYKKIHKELTLNMQEKKDKILVLEKIKKLMET